MPEPRRVGSRPFKQVDVFTSVPFKGNPLAVVLDADGLSVQQMQAMARWTNLSETAFVLKPGVPEADYRLRIFSPDTEFPFAGHPTLGAAHALLEAGLQPRRAGQLVQECAIGLVPIAIKARQTLAFRAPEAQLQAFHAALLPTLEAALQSRAFGTEPAPVIAGMGVKWLVVRMDSAADCLAVRPDIEALLQLIQLGITGVALYGAHPPGGPADYEVRALFTKHGMLVEDPVTGSANACIARVMAGQGAYSVRQGTRLECDGRVAVSYVDGTPWIGGQSVTVIDGMLLPGLPPAT